MTQIEESPDSGWVPVDACTLPTEQQPLRVAEFDALLRSSVRWVDRRTDTWLRLGLTDADHGYDRARELTTREADCCSFFAFEVRHTDSDVVIDIRVPAGRVAVLDGLHQRAVAAVAGRQTR